jgi:AraC-like DNA-binding protein
VRLQKLVELRAVLQARYAVESSTLAPASLPKSEPSLEDRFLQKIHEAVLEKLGDPELDIAHLCQATHLSHTQVFRKLKALTGKNPTQYIRSLRLRQALELLQTTHLTVSEVAYRTGFNDPNYFSRAFQKEYGAAPREVRN